MLALWIRGACKLEVFEIVQPGAFLVCSDEGYRQKADSLLGFMRQQFFDANEAVNMFVAFEAERDPKSLYAEMEERRPRLPPMDQPPDREPAIAVEDLIAHSLDAMKQRKHERWARGDVPLELRLAKQRICAQGFLYSVHMFFQLLQKLNRSGYELAELRALEDRWKAMFPNLTGLRDSTQHADERVLGRHRSSWGKGEIELQPVENDAVSAPGGFLGVANLMGNRYQATTAHGLLAEVEVSFESLRKLQEFFHAVLSTFSWTGPEVHFPID